MIKKLLTTVALAALSTIAMWAQNGGNGSPGQYQNYTALYIVPTVNDVPVTSDMNVVFNAYMDGELRATSTADNFRYNWGNSNYTSVTFLVPGDDADLNKSITLTATYKEEVYTWYGAAIKWTGESDVPQAPFRFDIKTFDDAQAFYTGISLPVPFELNAGTQASLDLANFLTIEISDQQNPVQYYNELDIRPALTVTKVTTGANASDVTVNGTVVTAVNSTSRDGVQVKVELGKLSATTTIYPYYNVKAMTVADIILDKGATADLLDYVTFTIADDNNTTKKAKEFCSPDVTFSVGNNANFASISGTVLTALAATSYEGIALDSEVHDHVSTNDNSDGLYKTSNLKITPFHYPITGIRMGEVTVAKDASVDLLGYVEFLIEDGTQTGAWVKAEDMNYCPAVNFSLGNYIEYGTITGSTLNALKRTSQDGMEISAYVSGAEDDVTPPAGQNGLMTNSTLYITPFLYPVESVAFKQNMYELNLTDNTTKNLQNELVFTLRTSKSSVAPAETITRSYAELDAEYKPTLVWYSAGDAVTVDESTGLAGAADKTSIEGVSISVYVENGGNSPLCTTQVRVSPYIYQINALRWTQQSLEVTVGEGNDLIGYLEFQAVTDNGSEWLAASALGNDLSSLEIVSGSNYLSLNGTVLTATSTCANQPVNALYQQMQTSVALLVTAVPPFIPVTSIAVTVQEIKMGVGDMQSFAVTYQPTDATFEPAKLSVTVDAPYASWGNLLEIEQSENDSRNCDVIARYAHAGSLTVAYDYDGVSSVTVPVTVGSHYSIPAGWSWLSLYNLEASSYASSLDSKLFGYGLVELRSQTQSLIYDSEYGYFGNLDMAPNGAYHAYITSASNPVVYGVRSFAPQQLYAGYTWLYYPYQVDAELSVLSTECFATGDMIIGKTGFATKTANGWEGTLTVLKAGESYISKTANAGTITWADESAIPMVIDAPQAASRRDDSVFEYDATKFANNMCLIARIDSNVDAMQVGAFVGDECRGEGKMVEIDGERYYFVTVQGKAGETVSFRSYDGFDYQDLTTTVRFTSQAGTLAEPLYLGEVRGTNGIENLRAEDLESEAYDLMGRHTTVNRGLLIKGNKAVLLNK